jgi:hypothetical protein
MGKGFALFTLGMASVASAADTTPPVLSLDLEAMTVDLHADECTARNTAGGSHQCYAHNGKTATYSKSCPVASTLDTTDAGSCPEPHVSAYDHHDGAIDEKVNKVVKVFLKSDPGKAYEVANSDVASVDYSQRGEFVITYDAQDYSGNSAETIIFAMILTDKRAPVITPINIDDFQACEPLGQTAIEIEERATRHVNSNLALATDLYDGDVSSKMVIQTQIPGGSTWTEHAFQASIPVNTHLVGAHKIKYTSADYASIFGENNVDNTHTLEAVFNVVDTAGPSLFCKSKANKQSLVAVDMSSASTMSGTNVDCADRCFQKQWSALETPGDAARPCSGWTWSASGNECTFYSAGSSQMTLSVLEGCAHENSHECGTPFSDEGAICTDMYDSYSTGGAPTYMTVNPDARLPAVSDLVNDAVVGPYTVSYTCTASNTQEATPATRTVNVVDTTLPVLNIIPKNATSINDFALHQVVFHSAGYAQDMTDIAELQQGNIGFTCSDQCAGDVTDTVVNTWHKDSCTGDVTTFATLIPGTYALKYVCTDGITAAVQGCRTVINVDSTQPIIDITGPDLVTVEASQGTTYEDSGAVCSDAVDGIISTVNVAGAGFLLNVTGTHEVVYTCQDSAANSAPPATRTVVIEDSTCPVCTASGDLAITVEASFPYTDAGAVCSDTVDGTVPTQTFKLTAATTVDAIVNAEKTGVYIVTYRTQDVNDNWNDDATCGGQGKASTPIYTTRTVTVVDTLKPVIAIGYGTDANSMDVFHKSDAKDSGTGGEANPADSHFMATGSASTAGQGWLAGAAAAAMSGFALIAYSLKRQTVSTEVPV